MNKEIILYFFPKIRKRLLVQRNRFLKYFNVDRLSIQGYRGIEGSVVFKQRLREMLGVYSASIFEGLGLQDKTMIIASAEKALRHEFDLLGSGPVILEPIDWHTDFKCGARWGKKYYLDIGYIKGADIKVPWELSRCQHLLWLGEAYLLTEDKKYAKEVIDEIDWWIEDNPFMYSVNWRCAMDVAFRAVNWLFALNMISYYEGFGDVFSKKVVKCLWQHAFFIRNNLEKIIPNSNNHYTSDLVGLLYLGILFSDTHRGRGWLRLAKAELRKELFNQVLNSGVHYEKSISYHRLMTEMLSYPIYLLKRIGYDVSEDIMERIRYMYAYISNYSKPNGFSPLVADNDDGRFVPFLKRDFRQHNYLNDSNSLENRIVSVGISPLFCSNMSETCLYDDAGVVVIRNVNDYLFFNHGGYSGNPDDSKDIIATHTHNDLLSFDLSFDGNDIIVDAGAYLYTSSDADRNSFRSTSKHNTIIVDNEEQNDFVESFSIRRNVHKNRLKQLNDTVFEGEYTTVKGCLLHKRQLRYVKGKVTIEDYLIKNGDGHVAVLSLHFAEGLFPVITDNHIEIDNRVRITFGSSPSSLEIIDDTLSPSYGVLVPNKTAIVTYQFRDRIVIETIIRDTNE